MADLRQNSSVLGKLTITGGGASNPFHVTGGDVDASTDYDLLKLLDASSGSIFRINEQDGSSLFEVLTTGTQIGGAYTLPHAAPSEGQVLTRATGAGAGVVSWEDPSEPAFTADLDDVLNNTTGNTTTQLLTVGSFKATSINVNSAFTFPTADGDPDQLLQTDGSGAVSWVDAPTASVAMDDITDYTDTGIADGDGIRYNGSTYVAGKWGVGTENQVIEANTTTSSTTARTIELNTTVDTGNSENFSITTLDLTDMDGNRLERCQVTSVDLGSGPVTSVLQEKYGQFIVKRDASGSTDPKILFSSQYAPGGLTAGIGIDGAPSNTYCLFLPTTTSSQATGQALTVKSGSTSADIYLELTDITLDSATDAGATTTNSITTGTQTINGSDSLIPIGQFNYTGTATDAPNGIVLNADNADVDEALPTITWSGPDSADNLTYYGGITCLPTDKTNGSEDSYLSMGSMRAGTFVKGFKVAGDTITVGDANAGTEYTLPNDRGTGGYVLTTDGSGAASWAAGGGGGSSDIQYCSTMGTYDTSGSNLDDYLPFAYHIESAAAGPTVNSVMMCPYDTELKRISLRFEANPGAMIMTVHKLTSGGGATSLLDTITFTPSTTAGDITNVDFTSASSVNAGDGILVKLNYTNSPEEVHFTLAYTIDTSS